MEAAGQSRNGIATKTGIPYATLTRRLMGITSFTVYEIALIDEALGTDVMATVREQQVAS